MSFTQQSFGMSWSFKLPGRQANPYLSRTPIFAKFARRRGSVQRSILWSIGHLLRSTFVQQKDKIYKNTKIWITKFGITMEVYSSTHYQPCLPTGLFFLRGGGSGSLTKKTAKLPWGSDFITWKIRDSEGRCHKSIWKWWVRNSTKKGTDEFPKSIDL